MNLEAQLLQIIEQQQQQLKEQQKQQRASITAHSNAEQNDKRTRELLQQIDNSLQHADRERKKR